MQNGVVSWIIPAPHKEIFNLGIIAGNEQQLEVSKEGGFWMLWKIVEILLVVATERQIEDADYKLAPRFLMWGKPTKKARRFSVAFSVVPDISQQLRVRDSTVEALVRSLDVH
jgi:hypothetical protein